MTTVYTFTSFIEKAGTTTEGTNIIGGNTSLAGHIWWRINAYSNGAPIADAQRDAGYTSKGITNNDNRDYTGDPAYISRTVLISESAYNTLKEFGTPGSALSNQLGFGAGNYGLATNSCVDYNYKAMELAGLNPIKFEGVPFPMDNRAYLETMLPKAIDPIAASLSTTPPIVDSESTLTPPADAATRDSASRLTDSSANDHLVVINKGGAVWDAYVVQKGTPNGFIDWNEFKTAVAASNPQIADIANVQAGQKIYLPEKFSDGSITYHMADGASINNNAATGECQMVLPNTDDGTTFFQRSVDPETGSIKSRYVEADAGTGFERKVVESVLAPETGLLTTTLYGAGGVPISVSHQITRPEDGSTSETTRYTDGRIIRVERDGDGVVTCTARIEEHSDGSRIESLTYANGVQLRQAFDESGALIAQDLAGPRWQTDPVAIESLAAGDSMLALAAFSAALRLKTEDSLAVVRSAFARAASVSSPLILDLDGDGVETTGLADGVYFDHDGNGFAQLSGWVARDDGLLVNDLDGDGQIRSGAELFGNETVLANGNMAANGFAALRELDGNQDAVINAADAAFARLRVWTDADMDAVADEGELVTLAEAGVASIGLAFAESSRVDDQGNAHRQIGQWTRVDGTMAEIADVWFGEDRARTQNRVGVEVQVALWSLPDLAGFGNVPDLHEAMALDRSGRLAERVRAFVAEPEEAVRRAIAEEIVMCWAGADAIAPGSRGVYVDARALAALENFSGEAFAQPGWGVNPGQAAGKLLMEGFHALVGQMGARLEAQTQLAGLYADAKWLPDASGGGCHLDLSRVGERLHAAIIADRDAGLVQLDAFARNLKTIGLGDDMSRDSLARALIGQVGDAGIVETLRRAWLKECAGGVNNDRLVGTDAAERLLGFSGNDTLSGKDGDDVIEGGAGDDVLDGGSGDDLLVGGAGNDTLNGGSGNDVYIFSGVFGHDTVRQYDATSGYIDLARFTDCRSAELLAISRVGDDLLLDFGAGEGLTVSAYFEGAPRRVAFEFAEGERWDDAALKARTTRQGTSVSDSLYGYNGASNLIYGLDGNDTLSGGDQADRLSGDGGDDLIYGHSGNDVLQGGEGDDTLKGGAGDDTLVGGAGNDMLDGGEGDDHYLIGEADGFDTIMQYDGSGNDTLSFGAGIAHDQLWFSRQGADLDISVVGRDIGVCLADWYVSSPHRVDTITAGDGFALVEARVQALVDAMAAFSPPALEQAASLPIRDPLAPVIAASWQAPAK